MTNRSPIFIVGASRSGTTMLRLLLNAHPHIGVPKEFSYFTSVPERWLSHWKSVPASPHEYRAVVRERLFDERFLRKAGVNTGALLEKILAPDHLRDVSVPYRMMLEAYANAEGKSRWGEKTPTNLFYCDVLYGMFPDARFIHLVRDPRAVVRSANLFPRLPSDTVVNATNWLHFMEEGYQMLCKHVPEAQRCTVRYEDLTSDPEPVVHEICRFIGEDFHPEMMEFHQTSRSYMPMSIDDLGGDSKVTQPIYADHQKKWRKDLTDAEIWIVERLCSVYMPHFGYAATEGSIPWAALPGFLLKRTYTLLKRWQHRGDRFHIIGYRPYQPTHGMWDCVSRTTHRLLEATGSSS